ncbi:MAG: beta-ketoacyl synthase N-terminal-like domain-containing protein [Sulfurimonadaceae bacterium]
MIYIHKTGSVNRKEGEELDVKAAWKRISPKMIRRTDRFIQLALLGAHQAIGDSTIDKGTALYMASGQGNLAVFKRLRDQRYIHKQPPKPVDFINSLSNTSGFYVAQYFGISGKNLNVSRQGLVVETTLLLAQNDLALGKEQQILIGGVDELQEPAAFTKRTLGVCDDSLLGEGSNWMLLSREQEGALASIDVVKKQMDTSEIKQYLQGVDRSCKIAFGLRCSEPIIDELLEGEERGRFGYEERCGFYETAALYAINSFIDEGEGELLFIENFNESFRLMKVNTLPRF